MSDKKLEPVHRIAHLSYMSDMPQSVALARDQFAMLKDVYKTTHPLFKPSPEVEAKSFTSFVFAHGGRDAVRWLSKNGVVAKPIVREFLAEVKS